MLPPSPHLVPAFPWVRRHPPFDIPGQEQPSVQPLWEPPLPSSLSRLAQCEPKHQWLIFYLQEPRETTGWLWLKSVDLNVSPQPQLSLCHLCKTSIPQRGKNPKPRHFIHHFLNHMSGALRDTRIIFCPKVHRKIEMIN